MADGDKDQQGGKGDPGKGGKGEGGQLPSRSLGKGEQLLIIVLVVVVGILFSMTSSGPWTMLESLQGGVKPPENFGYTERQTRSLQRVQEAITRAQMPGLPDWYVRQQLQPWTYWARSMWMADLAAEHGLTPTGSALDQVVKRRLARRMYDGRTLQQALADLDPDQAITVGELEKYLKVEAGSSNLLRHLSPSPVVPRTVTPSLRGLREDQLELIGVRLSGALVAEAHRGSVTEEEIEAAHKELGRSFFMVPARRVVTAFVADPASFTEHHYVSKDRLQAAYEADQERFRLPDPPPPEVEEGAEPPPPPEPRYQPLDEVSAGLTETIGLADRQELAAELRKRFDLAIRERAKADGVQASKLELPTLIEIAEATVIRKEEHPDRLSGDLTLTVLPDLVVEQPREEQDQLPEIAGLGKVQISGSLWDGVAGNGFTEVVRTGTQHERDPKILLVLGDLTPSAIRAKDEVRDDLVLYVAARKGWEDLQAKAAELRDAAAVAGGLKAYFGEEGNAEQWRTEVETFTERPLLWQLRAPAATVDDLKGTSRRIISLARPDRPIALVKAIASADGRQELSVQEWERDEAPKGVADVLPQILLLQGGEYRPAGEEGSKITVENAVAAYGRMVEDYQRILVFERYTTAEQ